MSDDGSAEMMRLATDLGNAGARVGARAGQALVKAARDIEAGAQNRAPVDTGYLRSSISTSVTGSGGTVTAEIGPTASYASFVETGTSRQRPQPYLRPATDAVLPGYEAALGQITGDIL